MSSSSRREMSDNMKPVGGIDAVFPLHSFEKQEHEKEVTGKRERKATIEDHHEEERVIRRNKNSEKEEAADTAKECELKKRRRDQETALEEERLAVLLEKKNKRKRGDEETLAVFLEKSKMQKEQKAAGLLENEKKKKRQNEKQEAAAALDLEKNQKRQKEQDARAAQDLENKRTQRKREQELLLERKNKRREEAVHIADTDATTYEPSTETENLAVPDRRSEPEIHDEAQVLKKNVSSAYSTIEETLLGQKKRKSGAMLVEDMKIVKKRRSYTRRNLVKVSANEDHVEVLYDIPGPIPDLDELLMEFNSNDQLFRNFFVGVPQSD